MNSSEVLHSNGTSMCTLPPMPDVKWAHSQSSFTACGGAVTDKYCYTFRHGRWETLNDQLEFLAYEHSSWMNENGDILLMGMGDEFESFMHVTRVGRGYFRTDLRIH